MSPVDARNDTEKIRSACLCKDDTEQNNSCDTAQIVARRSEGKRVVDFCVLPESLRKLV